MSEPTKQDWLKNPGPHKIDKFQWASIILLVAIVAGLWFAAVSGWAKEPEAVAPASISSNVEGVQAVFQANDFNARTLDLGMKISLTGTNEIVDHRGLLTSDIELVILSDVGVTKVQMSKGEPLESQEVTIKADGDINQYPYDKYNAEIVLRTEKVLNDGTLKPLKLSVGTDHAETGWFTSYSIDPEEANQTKVSIVSMHREPFQIDFSILLISVLLVLGIMSVVVGFLSITNRRVCDAGVIGWLVGIFFALPFARLMLPGDPPLGVSLDVKMYVWTMIFTTVAIIVATIAWIRQSRAAHQS